mgnify:CR=1 FL=1
MSKWNLKDNNLFNFKYWELVGENLSHVEYDDIIHYDSVKILKLDTFESEILLDGNFIKRHQCNCSHWTQQEPCEHILCLVYLIRQKKIIYKTVHKTSENQGVKRLDMKSILNEISHDELMSFVKIYSKRNSNFSHQMIAHFAYKLNSVDHDEKYETLFSKILNQPKDKFNYLTPSSIRDLNKLFITFGEQLKILCSLHDYQQVYSLLKVCIYNFNKSLPNIKKDHHEFTIANFQNLLDNFQFESTISLSPTLLDLYHIELSDWIKKRIFINKGLSIKLLYILISICDREKLQHLQLTLENEILTIENLSFKENYVAISLVISSILNDIDNQIIQKYNNYDISINLALDYLLDHQYYQKAIHLIKTIESDKINIDDYLLRIYILENDKSNIVNSAKSLFLKNYDIRYLEILHRTMPRNIFTKWLSNIIIQLKQENNWDQMINIFYFLHDIETIKSLLFEKADMQFWIDHSSKVKSSMNNNDFTLLSDFIFQFLQDHLGKKAAEKVKLLLNKLKTPKTEININKIQDLILEKYLDRPSISKMNDIEIKIVI